MSEDVWFLLTVALVVSMTLMFAAWVIARRMDKPGIGDLAWAFGFTAVAMIFFAVGTGAPSRRLLIAAMVVIWSVRLAIQLWLRMAGGTEAARHGMLRERFPNNLWFVLFGYFQLQALLLTVLCVPFALAASNPTPRLQPWEWAGAGVWLIALVGEAIADWQLRRFRARNRSGVCRTGLWRLSRHPNYFFEWLVWVAFFLFALGTPHGWIAVCAPLLMLHSLLWGSGIPLTEAAMARSRGEAYEAYRRTTSAFVPWFPRA